MFFSSQQTNNLLVCFFLCDLLLLIPLFSAKTQNFNCNIIVMTDRASEKTMSSAGVWYGCKYDAVYCISFFCTEVKPHQLKDLLHLHLSLSAVSCIDTCL